jgi:hypothetical protein
MPTCAAPQKPPVSFERPKPIPTRLATGRLVRAVVPVAGRVLGLFRAMYAVMGRSVRLRLQTGYRPGDRGSGCSRRRRLRRRPAYAGFTARLRGRTQGARTRVIDDHIVLRDALDLTVTIDYNVVDGPPATRFGAELRSVLERSIVLAPALRSDPASQRDR